MAALLAAVGPIVQGVSLAAGAAGAILKLGRKNDPSRPILAHDSQELQIAADHARISTSVAGRPDPILPDLPTKFSELGDYNAATAHVIEKTSNDTGATLLKATAINNAASVPHAEGSEEAIMAEKANNLIVASGNVIYNDPEYAAKVGPHFPQIAVGATSHDTHAIRSTPLENRKHAKTTPIPQPGTGKSIELRGEHQTHLDPVVGGTVTARVTNSVVTPSWAMGRPSVAQYSPLSTPRFIPDASDVPPAVFITVLDDSTPKKPVWADPTSLVYPPPTIPCSLVAWDVGAGAQGGAPVAPDEAIEPYAAGCIYVSASAPDIIDKSTEEALDLSVLALPGVLEGGTPSTTKVVLQLVKGTCAGLTVAPEFFQKSVLSWGKPGSDNDSASSANMSTMYDHYAQINVAPYARKRWIIIWTEFSAQWESVDLNASAVITLPIHDDSDFTVNVACLIDYPTADGTIKRPTGNSWSIKHFQKPRRTQISNPTNHWMVRKNIASRRPDVITAPSAPPGIVSLSSGAGHAAMSQSSQVSSVMPGADKVPLTSTTTLEDTLKTIPSGHLRTGPRDVLTAAPNGIASLRHTVMSKVASFDPENEEDVDSLAHKCGDQVDIKALMKAAQVRYNGVKETPAVPATGTEPAVPAVTASDEDRLNAVREWLGTISTTSFATAPAALIKHRQAVKIVGTYAASGLPDAAPLALGPAADLPHTCS